MQTEHVHAASTNHALLASVNHGGRRSLQLRSRESLAVKGVVAAKEAGAPYKAPDKQRIKLLQLARLRTRPLQIRLPRQGD